MGKDNKREKGYNWQARKVVHTDIDNTSTSKIKLDLGTVPKGSYDQCNALVIPSAKRKTKKKRESVTTTKLLSKKHRKRLEKVVEQKNKKENRASLLEALAQVQAPADLLKHLTSISAMQTKGLKRHFNEVENGVDDVVRPAEEQRPRRINSIAGSAKRRRMLALQQDEDEEDEKEVERDPNIVGFESSSDSSGEESEDSEIPKALLPVSQDPVEKSDSVSCGTDISDSGHKEDKSSTQEKTYSEQKIPTLIISEDKSNNVRAANRVKSKKDDKDTPSSKPAVFVPVHRTAEVQTSRMKLPILAEEQVVMETVNENSVVIIAGETGSGKTTQVPQFLYEAGYASSGQLIGVTEPRRVAAISMAMRVGQEMSLSNREVSYLIRFEGNVTDDTKIKFMTDGVLLKEIQTDFLLSRYSVIILDEAHERGVYTDILIGLLSRIVPLRNKRGQPLKLIIMSATLRLEDFTDNSRLFKKPPPVVKVESRQFPVTIHFNKRTALDYVSEAYKKACKIHTQLPEGGILIFLTGQQEVNSLVRRLRKSFPVGSRKNSSNNDEDEVEDGLRNALRSGRKSRRKRDSEVQLPVIDLDNFSVVPHDDTEIDLLDENDEFLADDDDEDSVVTQGQPMWVLPLYSLLPSRSQAQVFEAPPAGCRLCVVATNVAETSLTIPGVKYVIDCGKVKSRLYDTVTGVSAYRVTWCSKAGANQRAGRAGRTSAGHCYRLYSSAVFTDEFEEFARPEIQRKPVDDLVLQMKSMGIVKVLNFPFPSSPDQMQLKSAEKRLQLLGALSVPGKAQEDSRITALGQAMSAFPVSPRYGKMLALSHQRNLLAYVVCMVAALSVQEVLLDARGGAGEWGRRRRQWAGSANSLLLGDPMVLLRAVGAAEFAGAEGKLEQFCADNGLRYKAIVEVRKLRLQLTAEINLNVPLLELCVDPRLKPPTDLEARQLRQIVLAGSVGQVAHRVQPEEIKLAEDKDKWRNAYRCGELEEPVFMHMESVLRKTRPDWVVFQEVFETTKMVMRGLTAIEPEWLPIYVRSACNLTQPQAEPPPRYDPVSGTVLCHVGGSFGKGAWPLPCVEVEYPAGLDRYKWFARFLLDGSVCPKLSKYTPSLLSAPATMVKSWANLQPRTTAMLTALTLKQVDSSEKLFEIWRSDAQYLLDAFKKWLPDSAHNELALTWPPIDR